MKKQPAYIGHVEVKVSQISRQLQWLKKSEKVPLPSDLGRSLVFMRHRC